METTEKVPPASRRSPIAATLVPRLGREGVPEIQVRGFVSLLTAALTVLFVVVARGQVSGAARPSFQSAVTYQSGGYIAQSVAIADLNDDGKPDIVVSNWWVPGQTPGAGVVGVLLGNGDGTFQPVVTYQTGGAPNRKVVVADVNGDGKPDILVVSCAPSESACGTANGVLSVLLGNGDGTFQSARTFDTGAASAGGLAVSDLNGDCKLDVILTNSYGEANGDGTVAVLRGDGTGTFGPPVLYDSGAPGANDVAVADVNRDGIRDLIVVNRCDTCDSGVLGVLFGNRDGTFQPVVTYPTGGRNSSGLVVRDVNGDGYPDVLVANLNFFIPQGTVSVLLGEGNGTFASPVTYDSGGYAAPGLAVADVNGDGKLDIVVANCGPVGGCGTGVIGVLLGNGNGTFQPVVTFSSGAFNSTAVAVGDLKGDGQRDLVAANQCAPDDCTTGSVSVLLAKGHSLTVRRRIARRRHRGCRFDSSQQ